MNRILLSLLVGVAFSAQTEEPSVDIKPKGWIPPSQRDQWTMTSSLAVGYGSDRETLNYKSGTHFHFNQLQGTTMTGRLLFDFEHILIAFRGNYDWLIDGACQPTLFTTHLQEFPTFRIKSGYQTDAETKIASRVTFWDFGSGSFSFIPALGYLYSHFALLPIGQKEAPLPAPFSASTVLTFTKPFQQDFFGPLFEGTVSLTFMKKWHLDLLYRYVQLAFRQTSSYSLTDFVFNANDELQSALLTKTHMTAKRNSMRTQQGGAELSYHSSEHWQLGLHFDAASTWTKAASARFRSKTAPSPPLSPRIQTRDDKLNIYWTSYRINFFGSYWF